MFEALVLIAIIGLVVHVANLKRRVKQLEEDLVDLRWPLAGGHEPVQEAAAESAEQWAVPAEAETESITSEPAQPNILYAEARPEEREDHPEPAAIDLPDEVEPHYEEPARGFGFEELFGRKLPIWAGGITLAVAGMLIVKLSIEAGLLSPPVRVIMGTIFGFLLIGGAELALRQEERVRDERVRQALSGAGIASLYASVLVASNLYHLIGPLTAMLGMAIVTALAIGLSLRFGAPSALLGLAGGLAAPALIGSDSPNIPLLSLYLALAVGGLCTVSRGQRWAWLGISALVGGFGWGLMLMLGGALDAPSSISIALYILLLGVGLPLLGFAGDWQARMQLAAAVLAAAQMAALVATGGFDMLHWALFGMISLALLWLGTRQPALDRVPPIGLMIALLLLGAWPDPAVDRFAIVMAGAGLIYGLPALWRLWRSNGGIIEAGQLAAILLGGLLLPMFHFYAEDGSTDTSFGLLAITLSALAGGSAALGWRHEERRDDARFAILAISSALLLAFAAGLLLPGWLTGAGIAATGLGLLILGRVADDRRLEPVSWAFAGAGLLASAGNEPFDHDLAWQNVVQWSLMAALAAGFAWLGRLRHARSAAQFVAPIMVYVALTPIVPNRYEPLVPPVLLAGIAALRLKLEPAIWASMLMVAAWAIEPVGRWIAAASQSTMGFAMLVSGVPVVEDALLQLLIPAVFVGLSLWLARERTERPQRIAGSVLAATLAVIGVHSLYKLLFAIGSDPAFVAYGLAERTLWEMLLLGAAALCWRVGQRLACLVFLAAAAAHFTWYTLLLHNPLWAAQAVGPWPVLNLALATYAVPAALLLAARRLPDLKEWIPERVMSVCWMVLILLFAATMLRQLFHGSLLVEPGLGQMEDIARSILAILAAIGFLLWGIHRKDRDWRIGSLVLMLAAVAKVFLWDTQGLEGLTRIASFVALGFSLIGIGWLYSRQLAPSKA
ncbi:MAG TPA: DUF2339 domain-containing protein [Sphingomicrobium sp.]